MKKRIPLRGMIVGLCAVILCTSLPLRAQAAYFRDVPINAWYRQAVNSLADDGILNGTGNGYYSPQATLTRGAFVTMLARASLSSSDLAQYTFRGNFRDVSTRHWANCYVNWASETGVVNGYEDGTFRPDQAVTRQEAAVMIKNFAKSTGRQFPKLQSVTQFRDQSKIASWALESVRLCQQSGVLNGDAGTGSFRPSGRATRAEAATICYKFLNNCETGSYSILQKRVNNVPVRAVVFSPNRFTAGVALGQNMVDGRESVTSLVKRTGATIAVNGAFFNMNNYTPVGTLVHDGRVLTIDNEKAPAKAALVMAPSGEFFVESFATYYYATLSDSSGAISTVRKVGVNKWPSHAADATRLIMTRDWGKQINFYARDAIVVNSSGTITAVYHNVSNVDIPQNGYVLCQRSRRADEGNFFDSCKVGMTVTLDRQYVDASGQELPFDPVLSVGAGPRLVKDGKVYGNTSTYRAEGFDDGVTLGNAVRACVGILPDGQLIILNATTNLPKLSQIMVSLGCTDAINLDGGGSTNLYVDGQWLYGPQSRLLNNMIYFK